MALGLASRVVDTAAWAPAWIGLVLSPWLVGPWLAGAWTGRREDSVAWGAVAGLVLLTATVVTYLAMAGPDAPTLLPALPVLAVAAGLSFGAAGAELDRGPRGRIIAAVTLGAVVTVEGMLLQQVAADMVLVRLLFVTEAVVGVVLAAAIGGLRSALPVSAVGAVVLGIQLLMLATIGPTLA